jgi:DNA-binding beta-propeller fold protein YncE
MGERGPFIDRAHMAIGAKLAAVFLALIVLAPGPGVRAQSVVATIAVNDPRCLVVNPETDLVDVATDTGVTVMDGETHTILQEIPIAGGAQAVAINPQNYRLYVAGGDARGILVLGAATGTQIGLIDELIFDCSEIAIDPGRNHIWLQDITIWVNVPDRVGVYDGSTSTKVASIDLRLSTTIEGVSVAVDPVHNRAYATYSGDNSVAVIDTTSFAKLAQFGVGSEVDSVVAHTRRGRAHVETGVQVVVVDGVALAQVGHIVQSGNLAVNSATDRIYIAPDDYPAVRLHIADGASNAIVSSVSLPRSYAYPALNEATGRVYVAHRQHDLVSMMQDIAP